MASEEDTQKIEPLCRRGPFDSLTLRAAALQPAAALGAFGIARAAEIEGAEALTIALGAWALLQLLKDYGLRRAIGYGYKAPCETPKKGGRAGRHGI